MESFGPIAPHYDLLMSKVPYDMWADYYQLLLEQLESKPQRILDVCCGTGAVAELLSIAGYRVTGVDISAGMIEEGIRKAKLRKMAIDYHVQDAAEMTFDKTFQGAYSFFDSFNYITDPIRLAMAFKQTAKALEPGSTFIFDLNTSYAFEEGMFDQQELRPKALIKYDWKGQYDPETRIIRVAMKFWREGKEFNEVHVQRAHYHEEVLDYLSDAGFKEIHAFESYTLDPPRKKSDRIHYACKLPS